MLIAAIDAVKVGTAEQLADPMTKPLKPEPFARHREALGVLPARSDTSRGSLHPHDGGGRARAGGLPTPMAAPTVQAPATTPAQAARGRETPP